MRLEMLRNEVKEWLKSEQSHEKSIAKSGIGRAKYNRIRKTALKGFEDLTFLANNLPEKQLKQIFSTDKKEVTSFFESLFSLKIEAKNHEHYLRKKEEKELRLKRDRLLKLAAAVLGTIGETEFVRALLPQQLSQYVQGFPYVRNFEFIVTQAMR